MSADQWSAASPAPAAAPTSSPALATPTATEAEKGKAAIAYVLLWITGLIIFFTSDKSERYARWHAVQSIALGIAFTVVSIALSILSTVLSFGSLAMVALLGLVQMLFGLAVIVAIVLLAIKAYQGTPVRLPMLAEYADKYA